MEELLMNIILFSGNAKTECIYALRLMTNDDFTGADQMLQKAQASICKAQQKQKQLIQAKTRDFHEEMLLLIHAQDHLMDAIGFCEIVEEMISYSKKINEKISCLRG